jgi:transposase-like protein
MRNTPPATDLLGLLDASETDIECRTYLAELRWPEGVVCPRCAATSISRLKARKAFDCNGCRYQFSVTSGTLFHDSHLPLPKWFLAIFILCESEKRISGRQLTRLLGVSYATAWYLGDRIGAAKVDVQAEQSSAPYFFRDVVQRLLDVGKFGALPLR